MSGDVQPRKRKDKKRKRDSLDRRSEADIVINRKASLDAEEDEVIHHGVHDTKMGTDDVHLHVQADHDTGGNWCAKIFFFSLLAILVGLIGLIILENRGLSDLDTPLSESKYKDYFEGWVDEHRQYHDDHHDVVAQEIEEHDEHDEPFEEEEDHQDEDDDEDENDDEHDSHDEDGDDDDDETVEDNETAEEETTENVTAEDKDNEDDEDDDNDDDNDNNDDDDDDNNEDEEEIIQKSSSNKYESGKANAKSTTDNNNDDDDDDDDEDDDDDGDDDDDDNNNSNDEKDDDDNNDDNDVDNEKDNEDEKDQTKEDDDGDDDEQDNTNSLNNKNKMTEDDDPFDEHVTNTKKHSRYNSSVNYTKNFTKAKVLNKKSQTEDYDGTFESLEGNIVDNDAQELRLLQEKAKLAKQNEKSKLDEEESGSSSILVKIGVGLALAYVARLVIIKKGPDDDKRTLDYTEPDSEILMQRRLTIAPDNIAFEDNEDELIYDHEYEEDEIISSENGEIEDEDYIEEIEIEIEDDQDEQIGNLASATKYAPDTFEQFNSMFRSNNNEPGQSVDNLKKNVIDPVLLQNRASPLSSNLTSNLTMPAHNIAARDKSPTLKKSESPLLDQYDSTDIKDYENDNFEEEIEDEMIEEEEDEDEEDVSDIDDSDLMKRLDAKYGKIPDREYESEDMEEEEVENDVDDSWTKIKRSSGAQYYDDDNIDDELSRANDEMLRNNFKAALRIYEHAYIKNPSNPKLFYGKAKTLEKLADIYHNTEYLKESIEAYKRALAFHDTIDDDMFKDAGINCIRRMRYMGFHYQAIDIHEMLIAKFSNEPKLQNELAVTLLLNNNFLEAKSVLEKIIKRWPNNGFAQVHYGYVLVMLGTNSRDGIKYLQSGIESDAEGTQDARFYYKLGEELHKLGRISESKEIYKKGVLKKLFLSEYQRSLYNVDGLKSKPFWSKKDTTYEKILNLFESNWEKILEEGINVLNEEGYFVDETQNLTETGNWKEFVLFRNGVKMLKNCLKAPTTCNLIDSFPAARNCKRGQIKFSVMHPNTHIWPHCGPSNCRLRSHLGLVVPLNTWIRVANETIRSWEEGKFLIFDDSFEHEIWQNGTSFRLVLIVDFWHPELNKSQLHELTPL